ncbi:MAG: hypothetical protein ACTSQ7_12795 [Alphaproteobacteria bacterium]
MVAIDPKATVRLDPDVFKKTPWRVGCKSCIFESRKVAAEYLSNDGAIWITSPWKPNHLNYVGLVDRTLGGSLPVEALVERGLESMDMKITMTKSRPILGFCAICTVVAFVSVSAEAQNAELDMELLRAAFEAADETGDGRVDEAELAADTVSAFVAVDGDGDGNLSAEELHEAGIERFGTLDADKSESLTIIEVMNAKIVEFQDADANGDGELTIEEISRFERRR